VIIWNSYKAGTPLVVEFVTPSQPPLSRELGLGRAVSGARV
jgi:hypothetical protein